MQPGLFILAARSPRLMNLLGAHWRPLLLVGLIIIVLVGLAGIWKFGHRKDPMEFERERRAYLNRVGRIVDGQVLEVVEKPSEETDPLSSGIFGKNANAGKAKPGKHKLLVYTYSISGVSYEAAQDITGLEERACLDRVVSGQPAGVKYDPANPSNSILLADDWSGLH